MEFEEAFSIADAAVFGKTGKHLNDVQRAILSGSWERQKYHEIATNYRCTPEYLKNDVGCKLWKLLSEALGEKVSKTNFQVVLVRRRIQSITTPQLQEKEGHEETIANKHRVANSLTPNVKPESATDDLLSERRVDYTQLRDLLADKKWKEADEETLAVMLRASRREGETGGLTEEDIKKFPCTDLCTINTLWEKYSNRRFGFTVQQGIWQSLGGQQSLTDIQINNKFCTHVGWRGEGHWLLKNYDALTFSISAPKGHLPALWSGGWTGRDGLWTNVWWYLFWRRDL